MSGDAFQDHYPDDFARCYGCGRLNEHGLHVRSRWEGDDAVCRFTPEPHHTAFPGFVYGGLIASLVDCHAMGTAAAAWMRANGQTVGEVPTVRFVTASLQVEYRAPTPLDGELVLRAHADEVGARKVLVSVDVEAAGAVTATGRVVAVRMPDAWIPG
jgi:acyl-coenzyme A thioesterase PaaI-like protein